MSAALLRTVGEALYGPQWQSELARDLRCSRRTVQRYAAGTHEPPPSIWQEIAELAQDRAQALETLRPALLRAATP